MASYRIHKCKNKPDSFGYLCEFYKLLRKGVIFFVCEACPQNIFFKFSLVTKTKNGQFISCIITVRKCFVIKKKQQKRLLCKVSMVWREPRDHVPVCHFSMVNTKGLGKKVGVRS